MNDLPANNKRKFFLKIVTILILIVGLISLSTVFLLKIGISLDSVTMGTLRMDGFSLQWQDKLALQIDAITLIGSNETEPIEDLSLIGKGIGSFPVLTSIFSRVIIQDIRIGGVTGTLHLDRDDGVKPGFLKLNSKDLLFRANLIFNEEILCIDITEATSRRFNAQLSGEINLKGKAKEITGSLFLHFGKIFPMNLKFTANSEKISFQCKDAGRISSISSFVDLFGLDQKVQPWITEYLKGSNYNLKSIKGVLSWREPQFFLDTFSAKVRVDDCEYTFAQGLGPVKAGSMDVTFSKGLLIITPQDAIFCGQKIGDSQVRIDFSSPDIPLTVFIKTKASLNDDILTLLKYYKIALPFKQTAGRITTDLTLGINLSTRKVKTLGDFLVDNGEIEYNLQNYKLTNTRITLEDNIVLIDGTAGFKELFVADIKGRFDVKTGVGDFDIEPLAVALPVGDSRMMLGKSGKEAQRSMIQYHIQPDDHTLNVADSSWHLDGEPFHLDAFKTTFSPAELFIVFPPSLLTGESGISAKISGSISIKEKKGDFKCDLLQYKSRDLVLEKDGVPVFIQYDQKLKIWTEEKSHWLLHNSPATLYPFSFEYENNILSVLKGRITYDSLFDSCISGNYNSQSKKGELFLENLSLKEKNIGHLLGLNSGVSLKISRKDDKLMIKVPQLDLDISIGENKSWAMIFHDLGSIHHNSTLLQTYKLDKGELTISSKNGKKPYTVSAHIPHNYPFLIKDNKPVGDFYLSGEITNKGFSATVNEYIKISYTDQLKVTSKNFGFNMPIIIEFLNELPEPVPMSPKKKKSIQLNLEASNSTLFFRPENQALADRLLFEYLDGKISMSLKHGPGSIHLDIQGDEFSLEGTKLNDTFMGALFLADFKNGGMDISAKGSFDHFSVLIKVEDTVLTELKGMNNILSFLNTVPALVTLSLPEFDTGGLPVDLGIIGMVFIDGVATCESLSIESPGMNLTGSGWIDFPENLIDMDFNIISRAKENLAKIPLAGYVLVGKEDKPSITIKISGDLHDPKVENSLMKGIVKLPFAVLFRTLSLPIHLVDSMIEFTEKEQETTPTEPGLNP